jgi:uncharacterized protein
MPDCAVVMRRHFNPTSAFGFGMAHHQQVILPQRAYGPPRRPGAGRNSRRLPLRRIPLGQAMTVRSLSLIGGLLASGVLLFGSPVATASFNCAQSQAAFERAVCSNPSLGIRDDIMADLYSAALGPNPSSLLAAQRRWLAQAARCGSAACIANAYDDRIGGLMRTDAGRRLARVFVYERGEDNGELLIVQRGDWVSFALDKTEIGPKGVAGGDVYTAGVAGTAHLAGGLATLIQADGCAIELTPSSTEAWSVRQGAGCHNTGRVNFSARYVAP